MDREKKCKEPLPVSKTHGKKKKKKQLLNEKAKRS